MMDSLILIFHQGGPLMYTIALSSLCAWVLFFNNLEKIRQEQKAIKILEGTGSINNSVGINKSIFKEEIISYLALKEKGLNQKEALVSFKKNLETKLPKLENRLQVAGTLIQILPLLGLLGTVSGMILTFESIQSFPPNHNSLANGISQALYTTEYGLLLAIPGIYISLLCNRSVYRLKIRFHKFLHKDIYGEAA